MKKTLAMLLAAAMAVSMWTVPSVSFAAEAADITGEWFLSKMAEGEEEYDASLLSMMGMTATLTLNEDGTGQMVFAEEGTDMTWTYENGTGTLTADGEGQNFTVEDETLVISDGEMSMTFSRQAPEAEQITVGEVIAEPQLADFNGTWTATAQNLFGMTVPLAVMDTTIVVNIQDGEITYYSASPSITLDEEEEELIEEAEGEETEPAAEEENAYEEVNFTVQGELKDGALVFEGGEEQNYVGMSLRLHDDGKMTDGFTVPAAETEAAAEETAEGETAAEGEEADMEMTYYTIFEKAE